MGISDGIASFIYDMLNEADGTAEMQRAELASRFNCVPSQINYVISTRFSPEHGYIVESRRGGGGYVRITRVTVDPERLIINTINAIGDSIDQKSSVALISNLMQNEVIDNQSAKLLLAATGENALRPAPPQERSVLRANILKQMLVNII